MRRKLIVMVKEPRPGRVKTRLGRDIGMVPAAWWFRHQSAGLLRRLRDPRWNLVLAVTPDIVGLNSRVWPPDLVRVRQGRGDLGMRMGRLLRDTRTGPVCVIGADIPGVRRAHIAHAFTILGRHDMVFGPAEDGGYWLVGLRWGGTLPGGLFHDVRWSSAFALADSVASARGRRVALADHLQDVDTAADLKTASAADGPGRFWR